MALEPVSRPRCDGHEAADTLRRLPAILRLRLQITPVDELSEGLLDGFRRRGAAWPSRFGEHVVGAQMQAELALRCREDIENGPVQRRVVGHDMADIERTRSAEACEAALSHSRRLAQHAAERKLGKMSLRTVQAFL